MAGYAGLCGASLLSAAIVAAFDFFCPPGGGMRMIVPCPPEQKSGDAHFSRKPAAAWCATQDEAGAWSSMDPPEKITPNRDLRGDVHGGLLEA
jgi:hypothetical protein